MSLWSSAVYCVRLITILHSLLLLTPRQFGILTSDLWVITPFNKGKYFHKRASDLGAQALSHCSVRHYILLIVGTSQKYLTGQSPRCRVRQMPPQGSWILIQTHCGDACLPSRRAETHCNRYSSLSGFGGDADHNRKIMLLGPSPQPSHSLPLVQLVTEVCPSKHFIIYCHLIM